MPVLRRSWHIGVGLMAGIDHVTSTIRMPQCLRMESGVSYIVAASCCDRSAGGVVVWWWCDHLDMIAITMFCGIL